MKPRITIAPTPDTVVAQISNLPKLGMPEIKSLWRRLFGGDTPTHNRQFLERRIAYKLQIIECRKTDRNLLERNQRRIDNLLEIGKQKSQTRSGDYALTPGTVLCRHYQGVDHEVVVQADGTFLHGGQPYTSLSQLAREITGTRWSGPVFFGLKTNVPPKKSARKGGRR